MKKSILLLIAVLVLLFVIVSLGYYFSNPSLSASKPISSAANFYLDDSKIFVVSANASYGNYPYPTVTSMPNQSPSIIARQGQACVIINVTLRNDYSPQNPAPYAELTNSSVVYVGLTAHLYNGETQVKAKDITNAFPIASFGTNEATASLAYGESEAVSIFLATSNKDITSFKLVAGYIGEMLPP